MEKIKIYTVFNGKVYEAEARETKKMYILDRTELEEWHAFEYKTNFFKDEIFTSPVEAVENDIKRNESSLEMAKRRVHSINSELGQLKKLKKSLINLKNLRKV